MLDSAVARSVREQEGFKILINSYESCPTVELQSLGGSAFSLLAAAVVREKGGIHVFVSADKDAAAYLCNDLYTLLDPARVMFLPTGYKRSIEYGQEDPSGTVQRTAALNAVRTYSEGYLAVCTYPEALAEKITGRDEFRKNTIEIAKGDRIPMAFFEEELIRCGFGKVDFVYDPGQYSLRGGIIDVFSFSENKPFRFDFFGDEVESIRNFEIASQLSVDRLERAEIIPDMKRMGSAREMVSFASFTREAVYWVDDLDHTVKRLADVRSRLLKSLEDPSAIDGIVTGSGDFLSDTADRKMFLRSSKSRRREPDCKIDFQTSPQPSFSKHFDLLADDIRGNLSEGYTTYILSENKMQIERLRNIFDSIGGSDVRFVPMALTLHEGFVSHSMKVCLYTDHQIFDRFHRYRLNREIDRSEALTIAELNQLRAGDYVVHIDHGVGRFGGLVKTVENGRVTEAVKLVYRDNDVLLVNVHALHRISKYKDRDSEPPKIYKLGSGAWQRLKTATKKAVKDMARELTALYARRKATPGFAFSPDTYLQQELEASFIYEDTPDQQKATEAVKHDMESPQPMDRLICGDVGFGKTEIAIRAAFKAATDGKQVAVLVPTTILSLQHYRTFTERLKDFPVRIEHLSRIKSAKETREILEELQKGRIDILIGTQKILGKEVKFRSLGLLIIDEEQKFGVANKEKLRQMSVSVDTLTMTATPIPRTLQFSLMGSRDLSVIMTPPPNRQPIATESHLFDRDIIKEAIEYELARHGQVYFVHNRVENIYSIEAMIRELVPDARTVVGHGRMNAHELEKHIMDFIYGEYDVLVATTIVENGIDIPNANTIIINNAQNFGLSDLHQLRGRVGRSNRKAFCYLLTPPDEMLTSDARRRLRALEEFSDLGAGFNIAMQDLDIRGAGNLLGAEQSGFIADIGFETYQKILNEAMAELRAEGLAEIPAGYMPGEEDNVFIHDAHIELDTEAFIPDSYVSQSAEKLKLYRELDGIRDEKSLQKFASGLTDRFGKLPPEAEELFNAVRMRWMLIKLGFEKASVKNGVMKLQFISNQESPYYKSSLFMSILRYVTERPQNFIFRQSNNKLSLTVKRIGDTGKACAALADIIAGTADV